MKLWARWKFCEKEIHTITEEMKLKIFKTMLWLEHLAEIETYDGIDYAARAHGAAEIVNVLGLSGEYIRWSYGK